ncbi:MAG: polysaccharide export outer membrane protein [Yoonia sp.]|jgi:polysaccharide export outer membrane protein
MSRIATFVGSILTLMLFSTVTFAQDYRVQPGDSLRVEVVEDASLNRVVLVSPDGRIALPGTGSVRASGLTIAQIQSALTSQLSASFVSPPSVFVGIEGLAPEREPRLIGIFVVGEGNTVGRVEIRPGTTLLQAIAQFGGFTNFAAVKRIQMRRGADVYTINYNEILDGTSPNGAVRMHAGDVIVIPQRKLFE